MAGGLLGGGEVPGSPVLEVDGSGVHSNIMGYLKIIVIARQQSIICRVKTVIIT